MKSAFFILLCLTIQTIVQEGHSKQLMYFNEAKTWREAERTCNECGGKLIEWNENTSEAISNSNLQKTIVWIGNYTIQNPWIVEKACITEEDLSGIPYYEINYNRPELCRRTCSDEQMFAVKGNQCHCVNVDETLKDLPCNRNDVKIYAVDYVFDCNFEKPCTNITFGQESSGLTWKKTADFGTLDIGQIGREKGHYLLLQYLTPLTTAKARILIQLKLPETYFCLSFKYYMYRDGSLDIFIFEKNGSKNFAWKKYGHEGHMWYSSTLDIKGHPSLMIEVLGAMENYNTYSRKSAVAIDDIKINSGSCNIERRLDCGFDESSCEWEQFSGFELVFNNYYFLKTQSNYGTIMSPNVYPYLAKEFCLRYVYYLFKDGGIYVKVNNQQIDSPTIFQKLKSVSTSFKARQKFNIEFEMQKSAIERITLRLGSCEQGINKEMCPVINIGDGARLSVDYCSKMINQTFICEFEDRQSLTNCTSGTEIIMKNKEKTTTTEEISSILTSIPQTSSDQMEQTSANSNTTNLPSISKETRKSPLETEFALVTSILGAVVILLLLLSILLCNKIRRNQRSNKENQNRISLIQNRGFEMAAVNTSNIQPQTAIETTSELALSVKHNQVTDNSAYGDDNLLNLPENNYQNFDKFTLQERNDSLIYQEMEEGDYDHLGESAERRKDLNNEKDNIYDHGQTVKFKSNGIYDTTRTKTDNSFALEPDSAPRDSVIYDHTN